ncbi:MAG: hypothetical protein ISR65_15835 [Bacteriovoracaceae bacterium]|nr:hypothetical protein [Bacteriovoracaceae bacterium]
MSDDFVKKASGWLKQATDTANDVVKTAQKEYQDSGVKDIVDEKAKQTKEFLDESGITDKAVEMSSTATEHLDSVSGKKILDLVEERLQLQSGYNDILATKLEEALGRIEKLEDQLLALRVKRK